MSIFSKIFLSILPILLVSLLGSITINYYFSSQALQGIAENWLRLQRQELEAIVREQTALLKQYQLEDVPASVQKAQQDALANIRDIEIGNKGFAFVLDADDRILGHPDTGENGASVVKNGWRRHLREQTQGGLLIEWGDLSLYSLYTFFEPWNWYLLVAIPKAELYRPIQQSRAFVLSVGVAGTVVLGLILWFVIHRLIRPLRELSAKIEEIGTEGPGRTIKVQSRDEIGKVGQVFNEMSHRLSLLMGELRYNEEYFRSLIEKSSDVILVIDRETKLTYVGPSVSRILGYDQEGMLGQSVFEYIHADDHWKLAKRFDLSSSQTENYELTECRFRHADETWRHFEINSNTLPGSSRSAGIIVNARDVTERNRIEQSKLAADAANKAKSELIAQVSHDIRTPMDAILGLVSLIRQDESSSAQQEYLNRIQQSARTLLGVINDLLDYAKIEEGKLSLEENVFLLEEVVDRVLGLFAAQAAEKDLELMVILSEAVPEKLTGDALRLEQVLTNLIGNAFKFTDTGQILLTIELAWMKENRLELRFMVRDTGRGIPQEKQADLFLPFTQVEPSNVRGFGGTGLGLTICRRLVNLMQGHIWVESSVARGASFYFTACFRPAAESAAEAWTGNRSRIPRKALIVHSNEDFQEMMRQNLKRFAFDTQSALSARQAVEIFRSGVMAGEPCHIVFLDHRFSYRDGRDFAEQIRDAAGGFTVKIVCMIPFGSDCESAVGKPYGADLVLFKPVCRLRLMAILQSLEQGSGGADSDQPRGGQEKVMKSPELNGARVLLAEDNPVNQFVQKEILESLGLQVVLADNGRQALSCLKHERPDLVLMDVQMPVMDGLSASKAIRAENRFADLPIIAMTAYHLESEREKCLEAGMNDFIPKPMQPEQLMALVARWIGGFGGKPATGEQAAQAMPDRAISDGLEQTAGADSPVDIRRGLKRLNGKQQVFEKSLRLFAANYEQGSDRVRDLLRTKRPEEAARYCHTMKGAAATICADSLHAVICDLEREIKTQQGLAEYALLDAFDSELEKLVNWIQNSFGAEASTAAAHA